MKLSTSQTGKLSLSALLAITTGLSTSLLTAGVVSANTDIVLEPIVVSPRYWDEEVLKVPGSLEALSRTELQDAKSNDLSVVAEQSPNVIFQSSNSDTRLVVRGVVAYPNALADPLGISFNGVALPLGSIQAPRLINVGQLSLFKGAQGAHSGRNSEAGLLSVENNEPGAGDETWVQTDISVLDKGANQNARYVSQAGLSRRVNEAFAITTAMEWENTNGVMSTPTNSFDEGGKLTRITWQGGVSFDLSEATNIRYDGIIENKDQGKEQFRYQSGALATPAYVSNYSDRSSEERFSSVQSVRITHQLDGMQLTSITGLTNFARKFSLDFDASPLTFGMTHYDLNDQAISQELRLNANQEAANASGLNWSVGTYFAKQKTDVDFNLAGLGVRRITEIDQFNLAVFGFTDYALTERLRIGTGARLDYLSSEADQKFGAGLFNKAYGAEQDSLTILPKVTAAFDLDKDNMLYASLSRGYQAGGYNYNFANDASNFTFNPEYSWTGEVGVKGKLIDGAASYSLSGFYTDIRDKQIAETVPGGVQKISNAAEVRIYGVEAGVKADLSHGWSANVNVGLQKSEAVDFKTFISNGMGGTVAVDYSGNKLPLAPELTYQLGLRYDDPSGFFAVAKLEGSGEYYFDAANKLSQEAFAKVGGEIGFEADNFAVTLWGKNLFNEKTIAQAVNTPRGTLVEDAAPREIGLRLKANW